MIIGVDYLHRLLTNDKSATIAILRRIAKEGDSMDYELTDEQKALYREWDDFYRELMKSAPKNWRGQHSGEPDSIYGVGFSEATTQWVKDIWAAQKERGYLNLHWPKEYGGREIGAVEQAMLSEIKAYHRVPEGNWAGLSLLAPSLLEFGTEEQKREFLPKILSGEKWFCQAWSEPDAGSDLASLTARAVRDGDYYVVNGQKTWVSDVNRANWGHSPFRTDPDTTKRHRGLSYFMYPLDTPGITVRPVYSSVYCMHWGEIFFEDVRIPASYRVGEENRGWYVTMATANSERSSAGASFGESRRDLEELVVYCVQTKRDGRRLIDDPYIREGLAELALDIEKIRSICYRGAWEQSKGEDVTKYAAASKIMWTELIHKMSDFVSERIGGLYGQMRVGSQWAILDGLYESLWEIDLGLVINVGTNDIQHNVIANWGLKLPKE